MKVDQLLAGVGAIGNGVVYLLERLPMSGHLLIVDSQDYGPENLGTRIMIGPQDVGNSKALFGAERFRSRLYVRGLKYH